MHVTARYWLKNQIYRVILPLLASFAIVSSVWAMASDIGSVMTLADMTQELRAHNPQLEQARQNYLAAKAVVPQVTAPNNPQIGLIETPMTNSPFHISSSQGFSYTLTQSFLFPGKKRLAGEIAQDFADFANTQTDGLYLQLLAQLRSNFYLLLVLQKQVAINQDNIQRLEQIKQISKVRYANNAAAYVDYLNAQVAKTSAENDLFALKRQADTVSQTINTLIGRNPGVPLRINGDLPIQHLPKLPLAELEEMAIVHHPAIKGASLQLNVAQKGVALAKKSFYPDFQVIFTKISDNPPLGFGSGNTYGTELDIVLPTWFLTKEKAGVDQAQANLLASKASDESLRQQQRLAVDVAYNALVQAVNQSDFLRTRQLPEAKLAYRLGLTNYSTNNNMAFTDLLTAQSNLHYTELAVIQSDSNAMQAYAGLMLAVGAEIEQ